ncbi:MAG: small subunit ribosomal protein S9 [Parcubacteria group bacterium Gr01-1014_44]|nr:MAG: small subunit ribosomal protein S9 [Parcubacteria group bacterium Gr01-1014_44]
MVTKAAKKKVAKKLEQNQIAATTSQSEKYYEAVGRRKSAMARVRIYTKKSSDLSLSESENGTESKAMIIINDQDHADYFHHNEELQNIAGAPLKKLKSVNRFKTTVKVSGGGIHGQAEAIRHGLARALILFDPNFAKKLKKSGYLTRDSREKERRKYGLKKARKAPQWAKR